MQRKLAVILAADVAGYSRLMAQDEEATRDTLNSYRTAFVDIVAEHAGRVFGTAGDSLVCEFASPVQAVRAAVAVQRALERRNADLPADRRMEFRIGLNLGDVMAEGDDILGDAVNVAARLQEVAAPAGICISEAVRVQIEGKLDFRLVSQGERTLKNIPRPVAAFRLDWRQEDAAASGVLGSELSLPDKPSIAVLPFNNMSGDPEQEYFADGITEDIITALSRYRWFFVIARNSTFVYKNGGVDIKQVARELGVRYVLEGSVRKSGSRVRVTAQLIEADTGNHLWAEKYDRDVADVFALQDELTEAVVGAIEPEILRGEGHRATRKPIGNLDAFDCCMRGLWHFYQFEADDMKKGEDLLRQSVALDPRLSRGHMGLARLLFGRSWWGWTDNVDADLADAYAAAERAHLLDDRDPYTHYVRSLTSFGIGRHGQALSAAQAAVDLSPNFALGYFALGWARIFIGHFEAAIDPLLRALRLSPNDRLNFEVMRQLGLAHFHVSNFEEALFHLERSLRVRRVYGSLRVKAACLGELGRIEEAQPVLAEMEALRPRDFDAHFRLTMNYANGEHRRHMLGALERVGYRLPAS